MYGLILLFLALARAAPPASSDAAREVVLATQRAGWVRILDGATLEELGSVRLSPNAETVTASPGGRTLWVRQGEG